MAAQIAQCGDSGGIVLDRHSVTGVSKFANLGDELPSNDGVGGRWEALASYNGDESETVPSFITVVDGNAGPILRLDPNLFPEVGVKINLRGAVGDRRLVEGGLFRVRQMEWRHRGNDCYPHVVISYVGSLDPTKLIYEVRFA